MGNKHVATDMSKDKKKNIYQEDRIFAAQNKNGGWYLSFTTMDPEEKFKQRRIATIDGRPPKEMIEEKEVKNDKIRFYLDKEKCSDFIEEEYKFFIVNQPSPWRPKKFGEKSKKMDTDSDSGTEEEQFQPQKKKQKVTDEPDADIKKMLGDCYALLLEISNNIRSSVNTTNVEPRPSTPAVNPVTDDGN